MMNLEKNVMYRAKIEDVAFGAIPRDRLVEILANGRQCGVLLEADIAARFSGVVEGTQGDAPDLIDEIIGTIQAKTYHGDAHEGVLKSGPNKGKFKSAMKKIFTTKSGLWDSMKRRRALGEDVDAQIVQYFDKYDCFCYIDISRMKKLEYSFSIVDTAHVKARQVEGHVALDDILEGIERTVEI